MENNMENNNIIEVPFEIVELEENSFHLIITAQIGSIEGDFIIDTGASITVIDRSTPFHYEQLEEFTTINSGGLGGEITEVQPINLPDFQIGGHSFAHTHAALIDLQYVNNLYEKHLQRRVSGLLGCDFLVRHEGIIDYKNKRLTLKVSH